MDISTIVAHRAMDLAHREIVKKSIREVDATLPYFDIKKSGLKGRRYHVTPVISEGHSLTSRMILLSSVLQDTVLPLLDAGIDVSGYMNICLEDVPDFDVLRRCENRDVLVFSKETGTNAHVLIPDFQILDGSFSNGLIDDRVLYQNKSLSGCHVGSYDLQHDSERYHGNRMQLELARFFQGAGFPFQNHVIGVNKSGASHNEIFSYPGFEEPLCDKLRTRLPIEDVQRYRICAFDSTSKLFYPQLFSCNAHLVKFDIQMYKGVCYHSFVDTFLMDGVHFSTVYKNNFSVEKFRQLCQTVPVPCKSYFQNLVRQIHFITFAHNLIT